MAPLLPLSTPHMAPLLLVSIPHMAPLLPVSIPHMTLISVHMSQFSNSFVFQYIHMVLPKSSAWYTVAQMLNT